MFVSKLFNENGDCIASIDGPASMSGHVSTMFETMARIALRTHIDDEMAPPEPIHMVGIFCNDVLQQEYDANELDIDF